MILHFTQEHIFLEHDGTYIPNNIHEEHIFQGMYFMTIDVFKLIALFESFVLYG